MSALSTLVLTMFVILYGLGGTCLVVHLARKVGSLSKGRPGAGSTFAGLCPLFCLGGSALVVFGSLVFGAGDVGRLNLVVTSLAFCSIGILRPLCLFLLAKRPTTEP